MKINTQIGGMIMKNQMEGIEINISMEGQKIITQLERINIETLMKKFQISTHSGVNEHTYPNIRDEKKHPNGENKTNIQLEGTQMNTKITGMKLYSQIEERKNIQIERL